MVDTQGATEGGREGGRKGERERGYIERGEEYKHSTVMYNGIYMNTAR